MIFAPGLVTDCDSMPNRLRPVILCVMPQKSCASRPRITSASATFGDRRRCAGIAV